MALGIPSVASPVGINIVLLKGENIGYLANTNKDWEEKLSKLVEDKNLRLQMGSSARDSALKYYSLDAAVEKFVSAIKQAAYA
jgi:glycosyltransferase involved in cell wall biosynthesis